MTAWRRPDYFAQVITGLRRCPEALEHQCLISVDAGDPELQLAHKRVFNDSGLRGDIILQSDNLGCAGNTGWVFRESFSDGADAVIMLEDDTLPARDFLRYMRTMLVRFATDEDVFDVSGFHQRVHADSPLLSGPTATQGSDGMTVISFDLTKPTRFPPIGPGRRDGFFLRHSFCTWGWGTWRRIRDEIDDDWFGVAGPLEKVNIFDLPDGKTFRQRVRESPQGSWGVPMQKYWRRGRSEVAPDLSRIQNIGAANGVFCPDEVFHRNNHHTEIWMDDQMYDGKFVQIDPPAPSSNR